MRGGIREEMDRSEAEGGINMTRENKIKNTADIIFIEKKESVQVYYLHSVDEYLDEISYKK